MSEFDGFVRRFHVEIEDVSGDEPRRRVAVAAIVQNPWIGRGVVADLQPQVRRLCPPLGRELMQRTLVAHAGGPIEAFGKAVVVGATGEPEHGAALIHTPFLSDVIRHAVGGTSVISSTEAHGYGDTAIAVPLCHVTSANTRSHYQGFEIAVPGAPAPDEIVVVIATSSGRRIRARIGDRTTDPRFDPSPWSAAA